MTGCAGEVDGGVVGVAGGAGGEGAAWVDFHDDDVVVSCCGGEGLGKDDGQRGFAGAAFEVGEGDDVVGELGGCGGVVRVGGEVGDGEQGIEIVGGVLLGGLGVAGDDRVGAARLPCRPHHCHDHHGSAGAVWVSSAMTHDRQSHHRLGDARLALDPVKFGPAHPVVMTRSQNRCRSLSRTSRLLQS